MKLIRPLDQAYIKRHNIESLLFMLERCQPVSRAELSRLTELSSASVTRCVSALISLGLVTETSPVDASGRGRRATSLETAPDGMFTLGCHIDPHLLRLCLLDFSNRCRAVTEVVLTPEDYALPRLVELIRSQAIRLLPEHPERVRGMGVSVSGRMDLLTGHVAASTAFGWTDVDLATPIAEALGIPVLVENDVRACLTWESMRLRLVDAGQDAAYLYLGRAGIGFASTVGGKLVRGLNNSAGEIEDVYLNMNECLNEHLMEASLVSRAQCFSPAVNGIGDILKAYRMGLTWSKLLLDDFRGQLNIVLQLVRAILDPHCMILGGDMTEALRATPGLLPEGDYTFGEPFEESCALGAAVIAMQKALHDRLKGVMVEEE